MLKKKLALAVAGVVPMTLWAQSNVTIYGQARMDFQNVKANDAPSAAPANPAATPNFNPASGVIGAPPTGVEHESRNRVKDNSSHIGFRGIEDLGGGLNAFFQIESRAPLDTGGGNFATRNSAVGLAHRNWGSVLLGQWDTPYVINNVPKLDNQYSILIGSPRALLGSPGFGIGVVTGSGRAGNATDAAFDRRQGDSAQYWTPNWAGFSARLAYSANEGKSPDNAVPEINPYLWSVSATYERGPLYGSVAYERHIDHFGLTGMGVGGTVAAANNSSRDQAVKVTLGYTFGNTLLAAVWERLEYENDDNRPGNVDEYERDAWSLQLTHRIGVYAIRAAYTKADDGECDRVGGLPCSADETGADQISVALSYRMSKRTEAFVFYTVLDNDDFQAYQFGVGGGIPQSPGTKGKGIGLGINHVF